MKIKQLAMQALVYIGSFIGLIAICLLILAYVYIPLSRYTQTVTDDWWAPTQNKILTAMAQHTPILYKNEYFTIVQYDRTTHKVFLKSEKGQLIVSAAEFYQP